MKKQPIPLVGTSLGKGRNRTDVETHCNVSLRKRNSAFTLVELIIVITILAILATIGFMSYGSYTKDARDANRITTVKEISNGLDISFVKKAVYPTPDGTLLTGTINGVTYAYKGTIGDTVSKALRMEKRIDPSTNNDYIYGTNGDKTQYQIATVLENNTIAQNTITNTSYADLGVVAKVNGNYIGYMKFSSGSSETWIANIPSLLWNNSGSVSLLSTGTYFIVDKKTNLPYKLNSSTDIGTKDANKIIQEITGTGVATLTGVNITSITSTNIGTTFSGALLTSFGGDINLVSKEVLGGGVASTTTISTTPPASSAQYVEDIFSTYLYTGNGSTQTINNGIDLSGKGGMVWIKGRNTSYGNLLFDTTRGINHWLSSNTNSSDQSSNGTDFTAFNSIGFTLGSPYGIGGLGLNGSNYLFSSWTFAKAPKFFDTQTKIHTTGTPSTIDLSSLGTVGMVVVKSTIGASNWFTWHKDLTTGNNLKLNLTDAQSTTNAYISVSGTTMTILSTAPSDTYVIYAYAHDTGTDGMIQAGSSLISGGGINVTLGWEPQYALVKSTSTGNWRVYDTMRGWSNSTSSDEYLLPNSSIAAGITDSGNPTATGFYINGLPNGETYIYLAIRAPMKTPTSSSEVFNSIARTGNGSASIVTTGFNTDFVISRYRDGNASNIIHDRLRGNYIGLYINSITTEQNFLDSLIFDLNNGVGLINTYTNALGYNYIHYNFKRAKGFFDIVAYTGNGVAGRTVNHNLGVIPELMIVKPRSGTYTRGWTTYLGPLSTISNDIYAMLNETSAKSDAPVFNDTAPTSSIFSVSGDPQVNGGSTTYIAYLFATLPGISKVGSYTGDGGIGKIINAGFTTGAKYIMIKRTDSTGDWIVWDTARGITTANDPHISLNTTVAEVTTDDSVDPENSGFIVNQNSATNINVNNATYIYYSIAN